MAKCCLKFSRKSKSEARNLPTWGCKSMMEGARNMLGVLLTLLYIYTMPIIYYCSIYISEVPLDIWKMTWLSFFAQSEIRNLPTYGCKRWWKALQSCWECSTLSYKPAQFQSTTIVAFQLCHTTPWWPEILPERAGMIEAEIKILGKKPSNIWVWKWDEWAHKHIIVVVHHLL